MQCFGGAIDKLRAAWPCSVSKCCHNMFFLRTAAAANWSRMGRNQCEYLCLSSSSSSSSGLKTILMGALRTDHEEAIWPILHLHLPVLAPRLIALHKPFAFNWPSNGGWRRRRSRHSMKGGQIKNARQITQ